MENILICFRTNVPHFLKPELPIDSTKVVINWNCVAMWNFIGFPLIGGEIAGILAGWASFVTHGNPAGFGLGILSAGALSITESMIINICTEDIPDSPTGVYGFSGGGFIGGGGGIW